MWNKLQNEHLEGVFRIATSSMELMEFRSHKQELVQYSRNLKLRRAAGDKGDVLISQWKELTNKWMLPEMDTEVNVLWLKFTNYKEFYKELYLKYLISVRFSSNEFQISLPIS